MLPAAPVTTTFTGRLFDYLFVKCLGYYHVFGCQQPIQKSRREQERAGESRREQERAGEEKLTEALVVLGSMTCCWSYIIDIIDVDVQTTIKYIQDKNRHHNWLFSNQAITNIDNNKNRSRQTQDKYQ